MARSVRANGGRRLRRLLTVAVTVAVASAGAVTTIGPAGTTVASAATPGSLVLTPVADTFVSATEPAVNFGGRDSFDVFGGTSPSCTPGLTGPAYGLLAFDLAAVPAGAVVTGARLQLTSRAGFAQNGDQNHHVVRLADTSWDENAVTWDTRPADGTVAPGDPTTVGGGDIRTSPAALGSASAFRATCGGDFQGDEVDQFPDNGYTAPSDQAITRHDAMDNMVAAVADARTLPGARLALEIYTPSFAGLSYWARYYSREAAPELRPRLVLSFASATVVQAAGDGTGVFVAAAVSGEPNTTYRVDVSAAGGCVEGRLVDARRLFVESVTTNADGEAYVTGGTEGGAAFVDVTLGRDTGELTRASACAAVGPDNDAWTRAQLVALAGGGPLTGTATGYLDRQGAARWYRFPVQPGGTVRVDLTELAADFDLSVFRDIAQAFTELNSTDDLTRLSAEFAPSVFSPSVFSPSVFSPSVFSPDAFAPSVFSPSVFSPSVFSPSVFSPDAFGPSVFSPSVFSPSVFSPDGVAPSVFSPETFASAQTRSLVATSSAPGTADESVVAETWNNTGFFYVRVTGRNGAFATEAPFRLTVTRDDLPACTGVSDIAGSPVVSPSGARTVVLLDSGRLPATAAGNGAADVDRLRATLATFAARPEVRGAVVDLATDARVQALNAQADANPGCPYAKNLVAAAVRDVVLAHRAADPDLRYVVIVGPDGAIPFFRYPDQGLLGPESNYVPPVGADTPSEASLRLDYVLGQDEYGSADTLDLGGDRLPLPDLAVGRLVETAAEAAGLLDAYLGLDGGVVPTPTSALVTGYDFLTDASNSVAADLAAGIGTPAGPGAAVDTLIAPNNISPQDPAAWTAEDLRTRLFGARHDLTYLAGHFSANSALAADFATTLLSTEVATAAVDFTNAIVFSAGCHSGYNIDDADAVPGVTVPLDWAQAFARRGATLIAGTGYQYGDTDFVEYSERIYAGFARQLRYGSGPVSVGEALMRAKQTYLRDTPDPRGLHRKSLIISTLFGLPMLSVDFATGRLAAPVDSSIVAGTTGFAADPGLTLGLESADLSIAAPITPTTVPLDVLGGTTPATVTATYYAGPDGVVVNPAEPALPLVADDVTVPGKVLRGVGFRGGDYTDQTVVPLTGAATTELRGVHSPFSSPVFFPMRLATVNYTDALAGRGTRLLVTPAQHRTAGAEFSTLRRYDGVDLRLFYSDLLTGPALAAAPSISGVSATVDGPDVVVQADVVGDPAAGIQEVWATYTGDQSRWASLDLVQCAVTPARPVLAAGCPGERSTRWVGRLAGAASGAAALRLAVHAVNGVGLVATDDALGAYYEVATGAPAPVPAATQLAVDGVPAAAVYGATVTARATLTADGAPLVGRTVAFTLGSSTRLATTAADGVATASVPLTVAPGVVSLRASFVDDDGTYRPSAVAATFEVTRSPTTVSVTPSRPTGPAGPVGATIALVDGAGDPLLARTVYVTVTGPAPTTVVPLITDYLGRATLAPRVLVPGEHRLTVSFLDAVPGIAATADATYTGSTAFADVTVAPAAVAPTAVTVGGPVSVPAGAAYAATAVAQGEPRPAVTFALSPSPAPPTWLSVDPVTGAVGGTVPAVGVTSFSYAVVATNAGGSVTSAVTVVAVTPVADVRIAMATPGLFRRVVSTYAIVVTNAGPVATTTPLTITDTLPAGLRYAGYVGLGWTCTGSLTSVTCQSTEPLPARGVSALAILVRVTAPAGAVLTNTAQLTPLDNVPANNTATATATVRS